MNIDYTCYTKHCKYNDNEQCTYNDDDFIENYLAFGKINDCHVFEVKEGYCECGNILVKVKEIRPYGDTVAYEYFMICPRCD